MEDIIIDNEGEPIIVWLTSTRRYVRIDNDGDCIRVHPESIDKLIEALQKVKEELNHV